MRPLIPLHICPARLTPVTSCAMLSPRTPSGLGNLYVPHGGLPLGTNSSSYKRRGTHEALEEVASPTRTCQSDYELLAGVVDDRKILGTPTKASGAAGEERHQSPSTTRPMSQAAPPRGETRMATQGLVGMRHHNRLSPTSPLQELQTTTSSASLERASVTGLSWLPAATHQQLERNFSLSLPGAVATPV